MRVRRRTGRKKSIGHNIWQEVCFRILNANQINFSENGLTTHCPQITACGVFLVNGDKLAQEGLDHVSTKEIKKIMPLFKNARPVDHRCDSVRLRLKSNKTWSEFHHFEFNGQECRLERVDRKMVLRAEFSETDVPVVLQRTKAGLVLCAVGNELSVEDGGEKVSTATTRIMNFLEMCGY